MPTDPKTGERLPGKAGLYAGEPGAPADAPPTPDTVVPERDLKPVADELDAITAGVEPGGEELLAEDEMVEGEVEEEVVEDEEGLLDEDGEESVGEDGAKSESSEEER